MAATLRWLWRFTILGALGSGIACTGRDSPPAAHPELRTSPPVSNAVWIEGSWVWQGHRTGYVWVPGHWRVPEPR